MNAVALLIVVLEYVTITLRRGPVVSTVDTATYSRWADLLVASHFDYFAWSRSIDFVIPPVAYSGWVTVVALNKLAFGSAWADGILALNFAVAIACVGIVLTLVTRVTASRLAVGAAAALFLVAFELFLWIPYALADVTFMFLTIAVLSLLYDWWICNSDRCLTQEGGNVNLLWAHRDRRLHVIDQNLAFDEGSKGGFWETHVFRESRRASPADGCGQPRPPPGSLQRSESRSRSDSRSRLRYWSMHY